MERLSGKWLYGSGRAFLVARSVQNGAPLRRSADSWDPVMEPIRSFQTVSGRRILGSTHKRCCVSPALCRKARPRRPSYDGGRHHPRVPHSPPGWYQSTCPPRRKRPFAACSRVDQSVTIWLSSRTCLYPPSEAAGFSLACARDHPDISSGGSPLRKVRDRGENKRRGPQGSHGTIA